MAVTKILYSERLAGLSSDEKPVDVNIGSIFTEFDTGKRWIWDGSNWIENLDWIYALSFIP